MREIVHSAVAGGVSPGMVVLVRRGSHQALLADGLARERPRIAMTGGDRFRIASITKSMVATAVLRLVDRGRLGLDDRVADLDPGLLPATVGPITVRQLLSHSSGLADYTNSPRFSAVMTHLPVAPEQLLALGTAQPAVFEAGRGRGYSNTNYVALGLLIEHLTGHPLGEVLRDTVFGPLEMTHTSLAPHHAMAPFVAHGYEQGKDVTTPDLSYGWAAGGVVSNAADVATFFDALMGGHFLRPGTQRQLTRFPARPTWTDNGWSGYGLGVARNTAGCGSTWGHDGRLPGFVSDAWLSADGQRQLVAFVNTASDQLAGIFSSLHDVAFCVS